MNTLEGYPIHVAHVSLAKQFAFTEQVKLVFTAQISNVTNTPHLRFRIIIFRRRIRAFSRLLPWRRIPLRRGWGIARSI